MDLPTKDTRIAVGIICGDMTGHVNRFIHYAIASEEHQPGIYYFAILASACYFESILEEFSHSWCTVKALKDGDFRGRLLETIASDVSRATGLEAWKKWIRVLYNIDAPKILGDDWKTLDVLFKLRNQLAHGRTTKFPHFWNAENGRFLGMTIEGSSYELPFKHLMEKGIISVQEGKVPDSKLLLTASVARYFWEVVDRSIAALEQIPELSGIRSKSNGSTSQSHI